MSRLMTAEQFAEWVPPPDQENMVHELVRGVVVMAPLPDQRHGLVCSNAGYLLSSFTFRRRRGYVCLGVGMVLQRGPDTVRSADVVLFEDAKRFEDLKPGFAETPPRLAIEVLAFNDHWSRVALKVTDLLRFGIPLVWLIDPETRDVTVYRQGNDPQVFAANQELTGEDVLPDLRCRVGDFFFMPGE